MKHVAAIVSSVRCGRPNRAMAYQTAHSMRAVMLNGRDPRPSYKRYRPSAAYVLRTNLGCATRSLAIAVLPATAAAMSVDSAGEFCTR